MRHAGRHLTEETWFHRWRASATTASWTSTDFSSEYELCCQIRRLLFGSRLRSSLAIGRVFSKFVDSLAWFRDCADFAARLIRVEKLGLRNAGRHLLTEATWFHRWWSAARKAFWTLVDFSFKYELRCQPWRHILTEATAFPQFRLASAIVTRHRENLFGIRTNSGAVS